MFKVLIADDQQYIRNGIADHIDWGAIGCEVSGLAANGEEALAMVKDNKPNVIITDIMMPLMTGLELVEEVMKLYDDIYIIIISAYDEFDYVQQALKLGAGDYILKPVDLDYLKDYISKLKDEYQKKLEKEEEEGQLRLKVAESQSVIKNNILRDLMYERISEADSLSLLQDSKIKNSGGCMAIAIVHLDDFNSKDRESLEKFNAFLVFMSYYITLRSGVDILDKKEGDLVLLVAGEHLMALNDQLDDICSLMQVSAACCKDSTLTIAIGNKFDQYWDMPGAYKKAYDLLDYQYVLGKDRIICESNIKQLTIESSRGNLEEFDEKELVASIKFSDISRIKDNLKLLEGVIRQKGKSSYLFTNLMVASIYRQALKELEDAGGVIEDVFTDPLERFNRIIGQETIDGMIKQLQDALMAMATHISGKMIGKSGQIERAKDYINEHYSDSDMSLESVAKHVTMSVSYFGNVFKQEEGVNFVDYLTAIRIDKAKELLKQKYKSYEVSEMVGYNNPTYFSTVFKRVTGSTPSKFA